MNKIQKYSVWAVVFSLALAAGVIVTYANDRNTAIRMVLLSLSIIGIGAFVGVGWKKPECWLWFVAPISWLVNIGLFYAARLVGWPSDITIVNLWSQVIHLQALILLIGGLIIYEHR